MLLRLVLCLVALADMRLDVANQEAFGRGSADRGGTDCWGREGDHESLALDWPAVRGLQGRYQVTINPATSAPLARARFVFQGGARGRARLDNSRNCL
jgi:hypothetical protein